MSSINRVRVTWTGLTGLPGISTFYLPGASTDVSGLVTFFTALKNICPSNLTWTIPSSGDVLESADGRLTGGWSGTGGGTVIATGGALAYASGVGARVKWNTSTVMNGRRLRGSTFITHLLASQYSTSGQLLTAAAGTLQTAATALVGATPLLIWHRGPKGMGTGGFASVTSATIPTEVSWLRTRRH